MPAAFWCAIVNCTRRPSRRGLTICSTWIAALQAVKAQVEAGGGTIANIVKVNTYLIDIRHRADYAAIREEFFGKKMPASTLVAVAALAQPEFLIEIEAIAVI